MNISIFDIPHIRKDITLQLLPRDLFQCVLVSKEWHTWFNPSLWSKICLSYKELDILPLIRNQEYVRSIENFELYSSPLIHDIVNENENENENNDNEHLQCPYFKNLTSLRATWSGKRKHELDLITSAIRNHSRLTTVELENYGCYPLESVLPLIQACSRLNSVTLSFDSSCSGKISYASATNDHSEILSSISEMEDTIIRELSINLLQFKHLQGIIGPLLSRCPKLNRLELSWLEQDEDVKRIINVLKNEGRSRLRHLTISPSYVDTEYLEDIIKVTGCDDNKSDDEGTDLGGLQSLVLDLRERFDKDYSRKFIFDIPTFHSSTLTELDLGSFGIPIYHFVQLLNNLPMLHSMKATMFITPEVNGPYNMQEIFLTSWKCHSLRRLSIGLDDLYECLGARAEFQAKCQEYISSSIGNLTELEELILNKLPKGFLDLNHGYLRSLHDLKRLWHLDLCSQDDDLSFEQVEWMVESWPRLNRVVLNSRYWVSQFPAEGMNWFPNVVAKEFQMRRPWMEILIGDLMI